MGFNHDETGFALGVIDTVLGVITDNPLVPVMNGKAYRWVLQRVFGDDANDVGLNCFYFVL